MRLALDRGAGAPWRWLPQLPALAHRLPADAPLAGGGLLRGAGATTCACCCAWAGAERDSRARCILDAARCSRRPRVARAPATTGTSGARAPRCTLAVDTLGHLLALHVTPANEQERAQVADAGRRGPGGDRRDGRRWPTSTRATPGRSHRGRRPSGRHPAGGGQAAGGQARLRPAAPPLGRRAQLRLDRPLPPPRPRLRAAARMLAGLHFLAFACLMLHQFIHPWSP